jgi:hypothetical protein
MVFKNGVAVDLNQPNGPATFWDYFNISDQKKGFLEESENAAGFQRGKAGKD